MNHIVFKASIKFSTSSSKAYIAKCSISTEATAAVWFDLYASCNMPAQYGVHTSILLIEYSIIEQLTGHCVLMRDIYSSVTLIQHQLN